MGLSEWASEPAITVCSARGIMGRARRLALFLACWSACAVGALPHPQPSILTFEVVAEYPHDPSAFTQGEGYKPRLPAQRFRRELTPPCMRPHACNCFAGLEYDRVCDNQVKQCLDIFWESTGTVKRQRKESLVRRGKLFVDSILSPPNRAAWPVPGPASLPVGRQGAQKAEPR